MSVLFCFASTRQVVEVTPNPLPSPPTGGLPVECRSDTGHYNEIDNPAAGGAQEAFGRNCPGYAPSARRPLTPDPFLVAEKLLARRSSGADGDYFKPAGAQLNIMAAAWIQAMTVRGKHMRKRRVCVCRGGEWGGGGKRGEFKGHAVFIRSDVLFACFLAFS